MAVYGVSSPSLQHPTPGFLPVDALASAASNVTPVSLPMGLFVLRSAQRRVAASAGSAGGTGSATTPSSLMVYLPDASSPSSSLALAADEAAQSPAATHIAATDPSPAAAAVSSGRPGHAAKDRGGDSVLMETVVLHLVRHQVHTMALGRQAATNTAYPLTPTPHRNHYPPFRREDTRCGRPFCARLWG